MNSSICQLICQIMSYGNHPNLIIFLYITYSQVKHNSKHCVCFLELPLLLNLSPFLLSVSNLKVSLSHNWIPSVAAHRICLIPFLPPITHTDCCQIHISEYDVYSVTFLLQRIQQTIKLIFLICLKLSGFETSLPCSCFLPLCTHMDPRVQKCLMTSTNIIHINSLFPLLHTGYRILAHLLKCFCFSVLHLELTKVLKSLWNYPLLHCFFHYRNGTTQL